MQLSLKAEPSWV